MSELPNTEDSQIVSPLVQVDDQPMDVQDDTTQEEISTAPLNSPNNTPLDQQREEIIESYSSTVANAQDRYPEQLQELRGLREKQYPQHIANQSARQEKLSNNEEIIQSTEERQPILEQQKSYKEKELKSLQNKKVVFFRGRKIANTEKEIEELSNTLGQITEKKNSSMAATNRLERDISMRPELQPLEKRFKELVPLFKTDLMSPEEKEIVFDEEFLSTLSLEEYLEVWRLGSPHYVAHVTRQGYRDHFRQDMAAKGSHVGVHYNGFKEMLDEDKKHKDTLSVMFGIDLKNETFDEAEVRSALEDIDKFFTGEEVLKDWLNRYQEDHYPLGIHAISEDNALEIEEGILSVMKGVNFREEREWQVMKTVSGLFDPDKPDDQTHIPFVLDKSAIHLSSDEILNNIYGGESANEIFVIYPTDMIASQFTFGISDLEGDIAKKPNFTENKWNDVFVWNENQEISIDAGVVFLPSNAKVNPKTGSKYISEDNELKSPGSTISSKKYWEQYFQTEPSKRPKHLVYYDIEDSPTKVVNQFLTGNGIVKIKPQKRNLGFEKNKVQRMRYDLNNDMMRRQKEAAYKIYEKIRTLVKDVNIQSLEESPITENDMRQIIRSRIKRFE